jgi:heme/copper-type cytochrome/quinol oxidase subunit 2
MITWLIVSGIVLLIVGLVLRTILMMRSSDTTPTEEPPVNGRELLRRYQTAFPQSRIPLIMRSTLVCGGLLLLAGISCNFLRQG